MQRKILNFAENNTNMADKETKRTTTFRDVAPWLINPFGAAIKMAHIDIWSQQSL